jgi:ATP-binding cassette, subfamily B, multidrug efflux pump
VSDTRPASSGATMKETERISAGHGPGRGPMGGGMVGQKSMSFGPSARRMLARMRPDAVSAVAVVLLAIVSVGSWGTPRT